MEATLKGLVGKVAIITGASTGIGAATAIEFSRQGALLSLGGRDEETLSKVKETCKSVSPENNQPFLVLGDLTLESTREKIIHDTLQRYGKIDILVNNAGGGGFISFEDSTLKDLDESYDMNVRVPYHLTLLARSHLIKSKGNIINISSVASKGIYPSLVPYCISKAAQDQFTKCLTIDLGKHGVRVNSVNPGTICTENAHRRHRLTWDQYLQKLESLKSWHALQRIGEPEEVARVVAFVASDSASFVTGSIIMVDGGATLMNAGAASQGPRY